MSERSIFGVCQRREPNPVHPAEARATNGDPMHGLFGMKLPAIACAAPQPGIGLGKLPRSLS